MSDDTTELKNQLRDANNKINATEGALKDVKRHRVQTAAWSAVAGFMLFAVGGHWLPGYQLDSTAMEASSDSAANAVRKVMSELCAERFMRVSGLEDRLTVFTDASGDWAKATYIRQGTWAETPDGAKSDHATAEECTALIAKHVSAESEKTS